MGCDKEGWYERRGHHNKFIPDPQLFTVGILLGVLDFIEKDGRKEPRRNILRVSVTIKE